MSKENEVRLIAYNIWEQENCPNGKDCEHWYGAEAIWEKQQKPKAVAVNIKNETNKFAPKTNKFMPKRKR
jgi:hypothetical protein